MVTRLRLQRIGRDMKLKEVAENTKICGSTLSNIELGKLAAPPRIRCILSELYGVAERDLFTAKGLALE